MSKVFSGLKAWYLQRITAVLLLLALPYLTIAVVYTAPQSFEQWSNWAHSGFNVLVILVATIAINFHAWVGLRDIIFDYVKPQMLKLFILTISAIGFIALTMWIAILLL